MRTYETVGFPASICYQESSLFYNSSARPALFILPRSLLKKNMQALRSMTQPSARISHAPV